MEDIRTIIEGIQSKVDLMGKNLIEHKDILEKMYLHSLNQSKLIEEYEEHKKICKCTNFINSSK